MMQLSKSVFLLLMLVVCLFFISLSAYSGEHPWDSEGGGTGAESDTSYGGAIDSVTFRVLTVQSDETRDTGGLLSLSSEISILVYQYFYDEIQPVQIKKYRRTAYPERTFKKSYSEKF